MKFERVGSVYKVYSSSGNLIGFCGRVSDLHMYGLAYNKPGNLWAFDRMGYRPVFFLSRESCRNHIIGLEV